MLFWEQIVIEWVRKSTSGCNGKGSSIGNNGVDSACTESVVDEDELWESAQEATWLEELIKTLPFLVTFDEACKFLASCASSYGNALLGNMCEALGIEKCGGVKEVTKDSDRPQELMLEVVTCDLFLSINWNGYSFSLNWTWREIKTWFVMGSKHLYALCKEEYPTKIQAHCWVLENAYL